MADRVYLRHKSTRLARQDRAAVVGALMGYSQTWNSPTCIDNSHHAHVIHARKDSSTPPTMFTTSSNAELVCTTVRRAVLTVDRPLPTGTGSGPRPCATHARPQDGPLRQYRLARPRDNSGTLGRLPRARQKDREQMGPMAAVVPAPGDDRCASIH